jgi:DNA-binding transcriptional regulator YiaG
MRSLAMDMLIWRKTYRIDQATAAQIVGVTANTWSRWEREVTRPEEDHYNTVNWLIGQPPPWWEGHKPEAPA